MTDKQTPPDWVLIEAAKRGAFRKETLAAMRMWYPVDKTFRALCDMIERYEQPPVDRKVLCAREAMQGTVLFDPVAIEGIATRAIELWEEGFGK
jgi:hypothetical protein